MLSGLGIIASALNIAGALAPASPVASTAPPICVAPERTVTLPKTLRRARDVRWGPNGAVYLTAGDAGVVLFDPTRSDPPLQLLVPDTQRPQGIWIPWEIGASEQFVAVGGAVYEIGWRKAPPEGIVGVGSKEAFEAAFDLDLQRDRILVLGLKRDEADRLAPKGELAWIGSLSSDFSDKRPVFFSADGPGARRADACLHMDFGSVRFLPNGDFTVLPHFEEGVYLYDPTGALLRTWSSSDVGFASGCPVTEIEKHLLSKDEERRWQWVNQRSTVDDILPFEEGPGILIRSVVEGKVGWELALLHQNGQIERCRLPVVATAPTAHIRGDIGPAGSVLLVQILHHRGSTPPMEPQLLFWKTKPM